MTDRINPMVEKVARAICPAFYETDWDVTSDFRRDICLRLARAAIEAMREPSEGMCGYVERISLSCGYGHEAEDFELIWRYMAEAALAEGDGK